MSDGYEFKRLNFDRAKDEGACVMTTITWQNRELHAKLKELFGCRSHEVLTSISFADSGITARFASKE